MQNAVQFNGGDEVDQLAASGFRFHDQLRCSQDTACVIHNASDHNMQTWPRRVRSNALVERLCVHGVGHPDPDSVSFFEGVGRKGMDRHGCDGCCTAPSKPDLQKTTLVVVTDGPRRTEVAVDADGWVRISGDSITPAALMQALELLTEK
jgi:hypothetical protein